MTTFPHRPGRGLTDVWLTPPEVIQDLGPFDLDPCAAGGDYAWRPWETAGQSFTWGGLERPWNGLVWLNPPYGDEAEPWLRRLGSHAGGGVALLLARTETSWWFKTVWDRYAGALFLRGRLHFYRPDGSRAPMNCGAPPVLVGYRDEALARLARSGLAGHLVVAAAAILTTTDGEPVGTWREAVAAALGGRPLRVREIYAAVAASPKVREAQGLGHNWRAQVRRTLQRHFATVAPEVWAPA